ncbi:40S ribosomal protein S1/3, eukaryotes [Kipferlia bialata]|uniref:Small ribosomal subunit protein eS1 n=1 Tax=Kipferlia bialata TaxID=797122 RepID=A0A9K3GP43_9EUKA|nr:40S ribosomal protein S1/3, eukaryotes [Kipferlia bialata]|eukprot:g11832.t1
MAGSKGNKKGRKGGKRKAVDTFLKKEWYDVTAPAHFTNRDLGQTLVTKTIGKKLAADGLMGRVYEVNMGDLEGDESASYRKVQLRTEMIREKECLTVFCGADVTRHKLYGMLKKGQSLMEAFVDVKTVDGYVLRFFMITFSKRSLGQQKNTCFANTNQQHGIRAAMMKVVREEVANQDLRSVIANAIATDALSKTMEVECRRVFPVQNTLVRKIKVLRAPRLDNNAILDFHTKQAVAVTETKA